jgi:hypothetical protein
MVLRFASSLFGMVSVRTPSLYSAEVLSALRCYHGKHNLQEAGSNESNDQGFFKAAAFKRRELGGN